MQRPAAPPRRHVRERWNWSPHRWGFPGRPRPRALSRCHAAARPAPPPCPLSPDAARRWSPPPASHRHPGRAHPRRSTNCATERRAGRAPPPWCNRRRGYRCPCRFAAPCASGPCHAPWEKRASRYLSRNYARLCGRYQRPAAQPSPSGSSAASAAPSPRARWRRTISPRNQAHRQ